MARRISGSGTRSFADSAALDTRERSNVPAEHPVQRALGILLTADVSYLKAVMEVRGEIVAAGYTPSAEVPTAHDLDVAIEKLVAHELQRPHGAEP
jgi:hypothetical protein